MKIFTVGIILLTLLTGCTKEEIIFKPEEEPTLTEEEKRNIEVINHLNDLIVNSNTNRSFTYLITINDDTYTYSGEIFENVTKGTYTHNNTTTNYQIENSKVYDSTTLEEIDIYGNINTELINITHYQINSNSYTCTMNTNTAICQAKGPNHNITFTFDDKHITNIIYTEGENITYNLTYSNFNNIEFIPKITYNYLNLTYNKTNNIKKETLLNDYNKPYNIYYYYVNNVTIEIDNKKIPITDTIEIFSTPMYILDYSKYIIDTDNISKVELYIYENDFIIIIINNKKEGYSYYLSTYNYTEEILQDFVAIN